MMCFTVLGEHDAVKDDNQSPAKVMPLSSQTPTFDANRCRHNTLTCPPWVAEMLCFTTLGEHDALKDDRGISSETRHMKLRSFE